MQPNFNDIQVLFPSNFDVEKVKKLKATQPFDEEIIAFLNALSQELSKDVRTRAYPDVATFAFFCRKANILKIKEKYNFNEEFRTGRGIVFHIAPSNVPVNFAYSLLCGLLSGNINIVRVSTKDFEQVTIIGDAITRLAKSGIHNSATERIYLVRYDRQSKATALFSLFCDVRIIWGGDETISIIRQSPLPSRSFDVTFADRYSLCVINADAYCNESNPENIAGGFYNDTYLFDQNACTAPHLLAWMGKPDNIEKAKTTFWNVLHQLVKQKYKEIQAVSAVNKLTALYSQAVQSDNIHKIQADDNLLWRIELQSLPENIDEFRCACGYFSECKIRSLKELSAVINRKYQTLSYYGFSKEELSDFVKNTPLDGIDRIVPTGHTMDFSFTWDGFDMIRTLSRSYEIL